MFKIVNQLRKSNSNEDDLYSLLIVDDNKVNRATAAQFLKKTILIDSKNIKFAEGIDDALTAVRDQIKKTGNNFDIIVMDYEMPKATGDIVSTEIRKIETEEKKIITQLNPSYIFSWSTVRTWEGGREGKPYKDANAFLDKPITTKGIKTVFMENHLEKFLRENARSRTPSPSTSSSSIAPAKLDIDLGTVEMQPSAACSPTGTRR